MAWILGLFDRKALKTLEADYEVIENIEEILLHINTWTSDSDEDLVEAMVYIDVDAEKLFPEFGAVLPE
jgi:hypothetical protein